MVTPRKVPVALVTGGARGIGAACAVALARAGFDIAVASLENENDGSRTMQAIRECGRSGVYAAFDVADIASHAALVEHAEQALGPIDCLVNNAGVSSLVRGDMLDLTPESFDRSVAVNLRGTFFLTQTVAQRMLRIPARSSTAYRSIVTITSVNAEIVGENRADYCMTKAALSMMSELYAARLAAEGIHVFEVRPGIIRTDMTQPATAKYDALIAQGGVPMARWGEPLDVGTAVATLAAGALPFSTGEIVNVGGGLHIHRV